LNKELLTSI